MARRGPGPNPKVELAARVRSPLVRTIVQVQELLEAYAVADEQHGKLTWLGVQRIVHELNLTGMDADRARWALFLLSEAVKSRRYREVEVRLGENNLPEYRTHTQDEIRVVTRG